MTNEKPVFDELKCGNCGYDGGLAHAQEKLEWQEKLNNATRVSDSTRQSRAWATSLGLIACTLIVAFAYGYVKNIPPAPLPPPAPIVKQEPPINPDVVRLEKLANMYEKCTEVAKNVDNRSAALETCNQTFKSEMEKK